MASELRIGSARIGPDHPVFVIAEAGVNHNRDLDMARELVYRAREAGADCVKFQTFVADRLVTRDAPKADYQLEQTDPRESQLDMLKSVELPPEWHGELMELCREVGLVFLSTPYNAEDVDLLDELDAPALKLASIHCVEPFFLEHAARTGRPLLLSTGMAFMADVDEAVRTIRAAGNEQLALLQCTTNYPSRVEDANLLAIPRMRDAFDVTVGYSDHTQSPTACVAAVALGARVIEKHFTLDKSLPGPDQSCSADPAELAELVRMIREAEAALGTGRKEPADVEVRNAVGMRRSLVARCDVQAGEALTPECLSFMRPATGVAPRHLSIALGMVARRDLAAGELVQWSDLEGK